MFQKRRPEQTELEKVLDELLIDLQNEEHDSERYSKIADQVVKLYKLKETDSKSNERVSADTLVKVSGNLLGILLIVGHERANVVTSKALTFVKQLT